MKHDYDKAAEAVSAARHVGVLTGAGISTLSGIADFRGNSETSFYRDPSKMRVFDIDEFRRDPSFFYTNIRPMLESIFAAQPSIIHNALALLAKTGRVRAVATQNIDALHQKAGSPRVVELHGSFDTSTCLRCGRTIDLAALKALLAAKPVPHCTCGGVFKPDVTFFGESLPDGALEEGAQDASAADVYLVLGTSLTVSPANILPQYALRAGARVVIVNAQPTMLDSFASFTLGDLQTFGEALLAHISV